MHRFLSFHFNSIQFNLLLPFDSVHSLLSPVSIQFNSFITSFQFSDSLIASFSFNSIKEKEAINELNWIEMKRWMSWIELNWNGGKRWMNSIERQQWIELKWNERKRCIHYFLSIQLNPFRRFLSIQFNWSHYFLSNRWRH